MQEFVDIALSFPAVVFTITTVFFLGFWVVATLLGAGVNALDDFDFDFDTDVDADLEIDTGIETDVDSDLDVDSSDGSGGLLRSALAFLGITGMPILIAINLLSVFSWMIAMIAMTIIGDVSGVTAVIVGAVVLIGSFVIGGFFTGRIARRFAHVFVPTLALRHRHFVGNVCTITTQKVSAEFGQAEVRDDEGSSLIVQVRCSKENDLSAGDRALIFDLDTESGVFHISPDKSLAP